jgi:hypothetical protein
MRAQITHYTGVAAPPVCNKARVLQNSVPGIMEAVSDHYTILAQDDPDGISKNHEYWLGVNLGPPKDDLEDINNDLSWPEILMAIRRMNNNMAPGKDGLYINVFKVMVQEECMATLCLRDEHWQRHNNINVDLPEHELLLAPLTPMSKALLKVLKGVWDKGTLNDTWNEVHIGNLFKTGNPELMANYYGISIISVGLKILLTTMAKRLETLAVKNQLLAPEQTGFYSHEECIAQFITVMEIVRHRHLEKLNTIGVFIDFKKAYNKVYHKGLYAVLRHIGICGKFLQLVECMYNGSIMWVRVVDNLGDLFNMKQGNHQGCLLSPILFILYVNSLLQEPVVQGVSVPGLSSWPGGCFVKVGMYIIHAEYTLQ